MVCRKATLRWARSLDKIRTQPSPQAKKVADVGTRMRSCFSRSALCRVLGRLTPHPSRLDLAKAPAAGGAVVRSTQPHRADGAVSRPTPIPSESV